MTLKAWFHASRPKTLVAGFVPVALGSSLAFRDGHFAWGPATAALVGALLIQIGTNLANDYFDFKKGADTAERLGPARATQSGWLRPEAVIRGATVCFALAMAVGVYLVGVGGWPVVVIGLASVAAGYAYTGGPYPLGYNGLGDVFVFVFFGLIAVSGTYFVQALTFVPSTWVSGAAVGALGVALLAVNNLRDAPTDAKAGKKTLVVRFGPSFGKGEYVAALAVAYAVPALLWAVGAASAYAGLAYLSLPLAWAPLQRVFRESGSALNAALADTARLQLVYGALLCVGIVA